MATEVVPSNAKGKPMFKKSHTGLLRSAHVLASDWNGEFGPSLHVQLTILCLYIHTHWCRFYIDNIYHNMILYDNMGQWLGHAWQPVLNGASRHLLPSTSLGEHLGEVPVNP